MKGMYWLVEKGGNPDKTYFTNDINELNKILGLELPERSYMAMEPGCAYWIMNDRVIPYDSTREMNKNIKGNKLNNMWR